MNKKWRRPGRQLPPVCVGCPPSTPPPLGTSRSDWLSHAPGCPARLRSSAPCRRCRTTSRLTPRLAAWYRTSFPSLPSPGRCSVCSAAERRDAPRTHRRTQLDPFYLENLRSGAFMTNTSSLITRKISFLFFFFKGITRVEMDFKTKYEEIRSWTRCSVLAPRVLLRQSH